MGKRKASPTTNPDHLLLAEALEHYKYVLKNTPLALDFMERRSVSAPGVIETFQLGYSNKSLIGLLPTLQSNAGKAKRAEMERVGVIRHGGHETLVVSLIIPLFDAEGRVVQLYGRRVGTPPSRDTPLDKYLDAPARGLFNREGLGLSKEVILADTPFNALTFWCAGLRNVTSAFSGRVHEDLLEALKKHGVERVVLAFARNRTGDAHAKHVTEQLVDLGIAVWRAEFPKGQDANAFAVRMKPASKSLRLVVKNARWIGKGAEPKRTLDDVITTEIVLPVSKEIAEPKSAEGPQASEVVDEPKTEMPSASEPEPLPATTVAASPAPPVIQAPPPSQRSQPGDVEVEVKERVVLMRIGDREYRVRGLHKNLSAETLKVNVLAERGEFAFMDVVDLCLAPHRMRFAKQAAIELGVETDVVKRDLMRVLRRLEALQEDLISRTLASKRTEPTMTAEEQAAALDLLRDWRLFDRVLEDFERCGVVGETTNKLLGYIAATSRKLEDPLAVVVQSSSAAGKTSLMEAILAMMPEEDRVKFSAVSPKSLYYVGEGDLRHKILAVVEEDGAASAAYPLKLLQSERELTIATAGTDSVTGKRVTEQYTVRGPVMIFLTTTAIDLDPELANRAFVLAVDEDRAQTRAIHEMQRRRETLEGLLQREAREKVLRLHRNAQRLIRPLLVVNPYAERLRFVDHSTRTRRDHGRYLALIRAIALLRQHQRPIRTVTVEGAVREYIEVDLGDIDFANLLAHEVLGRSLDDLAPQTRTLLGLLHRMRVEVSKAKAIAPTEFRFGRRQVREYTGWTHDAVRVHLERLVALEYVRIEAGGRGKSHLYELLYDGQGAAGGRFLVGLIDVDQLRTEGTVVPSNPDRGGGVAPQWSPNGGPLVSEESDENATSDDELSAHAVKNGEIEAPLAAAEVER
jgi:DNA primase